MKIYFFGIIIIFYILGFSLDAHALSKEEAITQTFDRIEHRGIENRERETYQPGLFSNITRERVIEKTLGKIEFELAIGIGYLSGYTSYEIDFPWDGYAGKSELKFPFDNWLTGGNISVGYSPFYLNFQGWTNISKKTNGDMEDKDWKGEYLLSSTKSDADGQMVILDVNLLYNFWQGDKPWGDVANIFQKGRLGFLVGYKYENFKYDIIGVRDVLGGGNYNLGEKVLDYKIQYHIPYLGLNLQYFKDAVDKALDTWGVNIWVCGSPYVIAKDRDDHLLRNKVAQGKVKGYGFLMGLNTFFNTKNHWICRLGLDYSDIMADGKQNQYWYGDDPASEDYDDTGDSIEGIDLKIGSSQILFWGLLQYKF